MNKNNESRTMSTEQIKRGLENIKKAQLQVLKQLKGDSFLMQKSTIPQKLYNTRKHQNDQNINLKSNLIQKTTTSVQNDKNTSKMYTHSIEKTNESLSSNSSSTQYEIQSIKKQFTQERQQMNNKLLEITNKLRQLQKQSQSSKHHKKQDDFESRQQLKFLQRQNKRLTGEKRNIQIQLSQCQGQNRRIKSQLQMKIKEKVILQTQIKSLKAQNNKLQRNYRELQSQVKQQHQFERQNQMQKAQNSITSQNKLNLQLIMMQIKSISQNHDFLFNKLKQSTKIQMSSVEKQSSIQTSISRVLQYLQGISTSSSSANYINQQNNQYYLNNNKKSQLYYQQNANNVKRSFISDFREEEREEFENFVKDIKDGENMSFAVVKREMEELKEENQTLRRKVKELNRQIAINYNIVQNSSLNKNNKFNAQSNRLITLQLQQMRQEVSKLKKHKQQFKQQQQDQQRQLLKYRSKCKQLELKAQNIQRRLVDATNQKFSFQKRAQQQQLQIVTLNSVIKQMNIKMSPSQGQAEPSSLTQLRQQFSKLLQTNNLLIRQKQSLKAMNQGLQVQVHNLKYQKQQYEANNKQKHDLIQRQIKERNYLLQQINKKQTKTKQLKDQLQKIKNSQILNEQQTLKMRKNFQDLLQQKNQEVLQLRKQIEQLYVQSRQGHQLRFRHQKLQAQYRQLSRKSAKMGQTLSHLWSVKQAQYFNINQILGLLRNPEQSSIHQQN